jgi:hypothetical protein
LDVDRENVRLNPSADIWLDTVESLRGMQERGDLIQDNEGQWMEGPRLDWETLPACVEAVIAERIDLLDAPSQAALGQEGKGQKTAARDLRLVHRGL